MKKVTLVLAVVVLSVMVWSCGEDSNKSEKDSSEKVEIIVQKQNYKPGEKDALIVFKAYADKDLETLKSYAGMSQVNVMDSEYFKTNNKVISFRKKINESDGTFKEIRYSKDKINFEDYYYLTAVFYESASGQLTAVKLKSKDKESWKLSGFGTAYLKKPEFNEMSLEIPE
ncbi:MAG: hypothetical protein KAG64_00965 [Bacteroidales bacterium]|nr:hypothetical protein [Bacteroidales bacterium]